MGCSENREPEFLLHASLLVGEDHTWFKAFEYFSEILEERSNGRVILKNYHSEQLAKEIEAIRLIQSGVIDMTTTSSLLSNWIDIMAFCEMPFLLKSSDDITRMINGPIGEKMKYEMLEKTGLRALGYFEAGPRYLTSNRPISHPDELNGLILRVPSVPTFVTAWEGLGAKPTPMAYSEVFTSLQQGTVQAQENPLALIKITGFYEVQKYVNQTEHVVSWTYPVIGERKFQSFPEDLKKIFVQAASDMQVYEHQLFLENEKKIRAELEELGMVFIEVDKEAFITKGRKAIFESLSPDMQQIFSEITTQDQNLPSN
jgi:tripartite ATP-independent transporter DctP family solute receptor